MCIIISSNKNFEPSIKQIHHPSDTSNSSGLHRTSKKAGHYVHDLPTAVENNNIRIIKSSNGYIIIETSNHQTTVDETIRAHPLQLAVYHRLQTYIIMHSVLRTMHQQQRRRGVTIVHSSLKKNNNNVIRTSRQIKNSIVKRDEDFLAFPIHRQSSIHMPS